MHQRLGSIITPWTDIILAQQGDPILRAKCLEELAGKYYEPIRAYLGAKSRVTQPADLDDLAQTFFQRFLEKSLLDILDREKGSLRGFLMRTADRFVLDEKRRGARHNASSPLTRGKNLQYMETEVDDKSPPPEDHFNRLWADELMRDILAAFKAECLDHGKRHYFQVAEQQLLYPERYGSPSYADTAANLGIDEKKVSNSLHRAKAILKDVTWRIVRATTASDKAATKELADLRRYYESYRVSKKLRTQGQV